MRIFRFFAIWGILLLVAGCATIDVNYDYDPGADFNALKTYEWMPVPPGSDIDNLTERRVKSAVNGQLEVKGLKEDAETPDFLIALYVGHQRKIDVRNRGYYYGRYGHYWGPRGVDVHEYNEGTLILDFVHGKNKELIWRGTASAVVDPGATPGEREKLINEAVAKIFKNYPPPKK